MTDSIAGKTPADAWEAVCVLRELRFSAAKIAEAVGCPSALSGRVLARNGLARLPRPDAQEPPTATKRAARAS